MNSANPLAWLRRALDLVENGFWALVAGALDALQGVSGLRAGLVVASVAGVTFLAARLMQRRLVDLLVADPRRTVRWLELEFWFSLPGLLWLPVHLIRRLIAALRALVRRLRGRAAAAEPASGGSLQSAGTPAPPQPKPEPLLVATLGPSFLLGGLATAGVYAVTRLAEPLLRARLGLSPATPAWQYLLLGGRPELGLFLPLQRSPFLAGLAAVAVWTTIAWWSSRLVRLGYRHALGGNRIADRDEDTVLRPWRRWAGATFLARPEASYVTWARWLPLAAVPLLAWSWFSLAGEPFRVEASEFAVAFVLWLSWAIHLSLRGLERLPEEPAAESENLAALAAGWPEVLARLAERFQMPRPPELDLPRAVEPLHLTAIPPALDLILSPLVLELLPPPKQPTAMQRLMLRDLSLLAYVHLEPPLARDRLELVDAADEVLEDRSGLRKRHQVVIAPEGTGKTTLALLAAANHVLVHTRNALLLTRDDDAEVALYRRFKQLVEPTTLRWNIRLRRAGTDLMNDLSQGIAPDVVVCSLQRLTVDLLGNERVFTGFLENLGLIVVDDVESFAGPVEVHAQLALRRLGALVCRRLDLRDLDERGAPLVLVLGTDSMDDLPAWARALCGVDAVTRDFTRSQAEAEEREAAELVARGIPVRAQDGAEQREGEDQDLGAYLARVRQGRHHVFHRLRDLRTATGEPLAAADVVAVCEQLAVPWHYRPCGDGRRHLGRTPLLLRDEPRHYAESPEDACVVFLDGHWSEVRRERRRLQRAGARFSRRRVWGEQAAAAEPAGQEPIAFITLVDPDEEMAFTQLDKRFALKDVLDRLPYPVLRSPSGRVRQSHLGADLVQHWIEVEDLIEVYGGGAAGNLSRLSRDGVLLTDPLIDVRSDTPRYERKLKVRALARATPSPDAPADEAEAAPLPPQPGAVEVVSPAVVLVRDRIRALVLARVDAAAAGLLYYPGRIFHDARGSYVVVERAAGDAAEEDGPIDVEPLLVDDVSSPRRRVRFAAADGDGHDDCPEGPEMAPEPLLIGDHPILVALVPVELTSEHVATYRLGPLFRELRQRQVFADGVRARSRGTRLATWALALYPNPEAAAKHPSAPALTLDPARLIAAALRLVLPSLVRGATESVEVALRVEEEAPPRTHVLAPWEGFFLFDLAHGGNGTARALRRDKVEELLRLSRLLIERVLDPGRLLAAYDHWSDEAEILAAEAAGGLDDGGGERWQSARGEALAWLDSRLQPEGRSEGVEPVAGRFESGRQVARRDGGEDGRVIDMGRCWYSREAAVTDLIWAKHRWRRPDRREAVLDIGFDRETATSAREFTESSALLALYRAAYAEQLADPALPDGTPWAAPREVWMAGADGRTAESSRDGLDAEVLAPFAAFVWSMAAHGREAVTPLARTLAGQGADEAARGRLEVLADLAGFVQGIPYSVPGALLAGLRPPVSTLLYRLGDCDSKSLLLALLAYQCGIPAGLFLSFQEGHALAAVAAPDPAAAAEGSALERLTAWSAAAGLPEPPAIWGQLAAKPGDATTFLYVPVETTARVPIGWSRVARPRTWIFLPLVSLERELPVREGPARLPTDRAERESRA